MKYLLPKTTTWLFLLAFFIPLVMSQAASAATGRLYLSPSTVTITKGVEFSITLRIDPGTDINGVGGEITYDASKLALVGMGDEGTAFPYILETDITDGKFKMVRATDGATVNKESAVYTLTFRALVDTGSTKLNLAGNAGKDSTLTNPTVESATITFFTPTALATPGANAKPAAPVTGTPTPPTSQPSTQNPTATATAQPPAITPQAQAAIKLPEIPRKTTWVRSKAWMIFAGLAVIILVAHILITIRQARTAEPLTPGIVVGGTGFDNPNPPDVPTDTPPTSQLP